MQCLIRDVSLASLQCICQTSTQASANCLPRKLSNPPQKSSSVLQHVGQSGSWGSLKQCMEINASHFEQCQRVPLSCSCGTGRSLVSVVSIRPSLPMQDLRYAGPSIGELSTITGAGEMTANRGPFFLPASGPTARLCRRLSILALG